MSLSDASGKLSSQRSKIGRRRAAGARAGKPAPQVSSKLFGIQRQTVALSLLYGLIIQAFFALGTIRESEAVESSSLFRQTTWSLVGIVTLALILTNFSTFRRLLRRTWPLLLVPVFSLLSLAWSDALGLTFKRAILLNIVLLAAYAIALTPPRPSQVMHAFLLVLGGYVAINFAVVLLNPELGIHNGRWAGLYPQKNSAGLLAGVFCLFAFFALGWAGKPALKIAIFCALSVAAFFLIMTGSKTPQGFVPICIAVTLVIAGFSAIRQQRAMVYAATVALLALIAAVISFIDFSFDDVLRLFTDDLSFTGRVTLWDITILEAGRNPVFGVGYGAFWHLGEPEFNRIAHYGEQYIRLATAHNAMLAIWSELGFIGLALTAFTVLWHLKNLVLLVDRPTSRRHRRWVFRAFLALTLFYLCHGLFEASLMRPTSNATIFFFITATLTVVWLPERKPAPKRLKRKRSRRKPSRHSSGKPA